MPKQVTMFKADCGGLFGTEAEAIEAERKHVIGLKIDALVNSWKTNIGSKNYTDNTKRFILAHEKELMEILK